MYPSLGIALLSAGNRFRSLGCGRYLGELAGKLAMAFVFRVTPADRHISGTVSHLFIWVVSCGDSVCVPCRRPESRPCVARQVSLLQPTAHMDWGPWPACRAFRVSGILKLAPGHSETHHRSSETEFRNSEHPVHNSDHSVVVLRSFGIGFRSFGVGGVGVSE